MLNKAEIQNNLERQRQEIKQRITDIQKELNRKNRPVSRNFSEQASERENVDVLSALEQEGREELRNIEGALQRLKNDGYGICTGCNERISDGRLEALPFTAYCRDCASAHE